MTLPTIERPATWKLVLTFAAVYLIWGSTYLAIKYAIETLPPLSMAGVRFLLAGSALYLWARTKGEARPALANWRPAAIIGGLLLLGGNGLVVLAERDVPSGLAALLIATEPLMIVLLNWTMGARPTGKVVLGLLLGFAGMVILVGPTGTGGAAAHPIGIAMLIFATLSWAIGSLYAARLRLGTSPIMMASMQMLAGGAWLLMAGLLRGEASQFNLADASLRSVGAFFYLVIFGSLIGFTSYSWLLRVVSPSAASTYAYVNPVVAVLLGWALAGEVVSARTLLAAAIIIGAVALISSQPSAKHAERRESSEDIAGEGDRAAA